MSDVYLDACVLIDALNPTSTHSKWAIGLISETPRDSLFISPIAASEVMSGFKTPYEFLKLLDATGLQIRNPGIEALHMAAQKHLEYRRRGGTKIGTLPDFFIGSQAAVDGFKLATRDLSRFRSYFPAVELIVPNHR